MYHALIGSEHRFGFGSRQIADRDLLTDVERAQILFARLGVDLCHAFSPEEKTEHSEGRFLGRLSDAHPSHDVEVAVVARQLSEVGIKQNHRRMILSVVCVVRRPVRIEHGGAVVM